MADIGTFNEWKQKKSRMTLDQAIDHARDVAKKSDCAACADQHNQLADWLEELKDLKSHKEPKEKIKEPKSKKEKK